MPLFEYSCRECGHHFETLVLSSTSKVACPKCSSRDLEKQFSVFGMGTGGSKSGASFSFPSGGG
jgi:threonyl-tRNA synthetase